MDVEASQLDAVGVDAALAMIAKIGSDRVISTHERSFGPASCVGAIFRPPHCKRSIGSTGQYP